MSSVICSATEYSCVLGRNSHKHTQFCSETWVGIMIGGDGSVASTSSSDDLVAEANDVFDVWMEKRDFKFKDFLFDGAAPLEKSKTTGKLMFRELISKFDTMQYFRIEGAVEYPSIFLLGRIHFLTIMNSGFQERVFSTCKSVMGSNQAMMSMDHLEMKALLCQNAHLIRKGVI